MHFTANDILNIHNVCDSSTSLLAAAAAVFGFVVVVLFLRFVEGRWPLFLPLDISVSIIIVTEMIFENHSF